MLVLCAIALTIAGCEAPQQAPIDDEAVFAAARAPTRGALRWPSRQRAVAVDIELGPGAGADEALIAATLEWRLSSVAWFVPRVVGRPVRPGLREALIADPARRTLRIERGQVQLCGSWGGCREVEDPVGALLQELGGEAGPAPESEPEARAAAHALFTGGRRLRRAPDQPVTDWLRARSELERNGAGKAVVRLERALRATGGSLPLRADLAVALAEAGRPDEALASWREVWAESPFDPRYALPWAKAALGVGDRQPATELLAAVPEELAALAVLATLRDELRGAPPQAADQVEPVVAIDGLRELEDEPAALVAALARTRDPVGLVLRGQARLRLEEPKAALQDAERALKARPWLPEALGLKADALCRLGRRAEAEEVDRLRALVAPDGPGAPRRLPQR